MTQKNEILVLGLGNDIMGDDAAGLTALRALKQRFTGEVDFFEVSTAGFGLMDILEGYKNVLILDSILSENGSRGEIKELSKVNLSKCYNLSPHYVGLPELVSLAEKLGISFPEEIKILGIEINEYGVIREGLNDDISAKMPLLTERAEAIVRRWLHPEPRIERSGSAAALQPL